MAKPPESPRRSIGELLRAVSSEKALLWPVAAGLILMVLAVRSGVSIEAGQVAVRINNVTGATDVITQPGLTLTLPFGIHEVYIFGLDPANVSDGYLIGIKNLQAETLEYRNRVTAEADGVEARLGAEGDALTAKVQGEHENKLNALLSSPSGRAYVAWKSADNVQFSNKLTFSSSEGIPSVLRLRNFAEQFMGGK